jgi:hypothetical protein
MRAATLWAICCTVSLCGCATRPGSFADDAAFVSAHTPTIELSRDMGQSRLLVAPQLQGRVLTSTFDGPRGASFGWINRDLFTDAQTRPHINAYGGEDRFWIGPEGGQFSVFFAPGAPFDMDHWQTPAPLDTEPFDVVSQDHTQVTFRRNFSLTNYSGTRFDIQVNRQVRLLSDADAWEDLKLAQKPNVRLVGYESINRLTNDGDAPWSKQTGLLSIWILGMFNASPDTIVAIPFKQGSTARLGQIVESNYFGPIPPDRLAVGDDAIFFRADANFRSKVGVSPRRMRDALGSYDSAKKLLTIVQFSATPGQNSYVNSKWEIQSHPFSGDAINSYTDGLNSTGTRLGQFYEIESSSPAIELAPGQSVEHTHRTIHLSGDEGELDQIAMAVLGVHLQQIENALPPLAASAQPATAPAN